MMTTFQVPVPGALIRKQECEAVEAHLAPSRRCRWSFLRKYLMDKNRSLFLQEISIVDITQVLNIPMDRIRSYSTNKSIFHIYAT